jgi:hypothetical protein
VSKNWKNIHKKNDRHTADLSKQQREMFFMTAAPIMHLVQRYRSGTRGHMKIVVEELLRCVFCNIGSTFVFVSLTAFVNLHSLCFNLVQAMM